MPRTATDVWPSTRWLIGCVCLASASTAHALNVFACEPEWASLVKALAPHAQVVSATNHRQDPHHIEARPSLIAALRRADLAVCTGAELEAGWLRDEPSSQSAEWQAWYVSRGGKQPTGKSGKGACAA